jgi:hypothetical protein
MKAAEAQSGTARHFAAFRDQSTFYREQYVITHDGVYCNWVAVRVKQVVQGTSEGSSVRVKAKDITRLPSCKTNKQCGCRGLTPLVCRTLVL